MCVYVCVCVCVKGRQTAENTDEHPIQSTLTDESVHRGCTRGRPVEEQRERERERWVGGWVGIHLGHCPHERVQAVDQPPHSRLHTVIMLSKN